MNEVEHCFLGVVAKPGMGVEQFLGDVAQELGTRVLTALPWDADRPGSLWEMVDNTAAHPLWVIHHLDKADPFSLEQILSAATRGNARLLASVSNEELLAFAHNVVTLTDLTLAETAQFIHSLTGHRLPALLVENIYRASGGRMAYIEELIGAVPTDHWMDENPTLVIPDSWSSEFHQAIAPLSSQAKAALYERPRDVGSLTEAIDRGIVVMRPAGSSSEPHFRDPRFAAVVAESSPEIRPNEEPDALLLTKARDRARYLDLPSAELFLRECTDPQLRGEKDALASYIALFTGQKHLAEISADVQPDTPSDAVRRVLLDLAHWRPFDIVRSAESALSISKPGSAEYEEASVLRMFGRSVASGTLPAEYPVVTHPRVQQRLDLFVGWTALAHDDVHTARNRLQPSPNSDVSVGLWQEAVLARTLFVMGQWREAKIVVERGLASCELHGVRLLEPFLAWTGAHIAVLEGADQLAHEYIRRSRTSNDSFLVQQIPAAMARMVVTAYQSDLTSALAAGKQLSQTVKMSDTQHPGYWPWEDIYAQTLVKAGRIDEAEEVIDSASARNDETGIFSLTARLAVPRAAILFQRGQSQQAIRIMDEAITGLYHSDTPAYSARVFFEYGQTLRRIGRRSQADDLLHRAADVYAAMGATAMVEKCNVERRLSGVGGRSRNELGLTAQEEQIAHLAADGTTNREIARQLTLSTKTVEYHLTNVYRKLDVPGRNQLRDRLKRL